MDFRVKWSKRKPVREDQDSGRKSHNTHINAMLALKNKLCQHSGFQPCRIARQLEKIYQDWEIIQYKSYAFEDEHPGAPKHYHAANKIVARKLKD